MMAGTRNYQSIGEVLVSVKTEFPDITISKIRFLEAEGLIEPERTPSGYRKFYGQDVEMLKSILRMQRDEYLPLKVIKERLLAQAAEDEAAAADNDGGVAAAGRAEAAAATKAAASEEIADAPTGLQMSLEEMAAATGVDRDRIKELESFGIVCSHGPEGARYYDGDDYIVLSIVKDFFRYGIEPRHLTMYKHFEEREASFFEQIVAPMMRQKNPDARRAASDTLAELTVTSRKFKQALLRTNIRSGMTS
jgi:DNA-binding transcriptional MerR regulator